MSRMRIFWAVYFILLGLMLLVKLLFQLDFSGWSAAFALLLLESGVFTLTGAFGLRRERHASGGGSYLFFNGHIALGTDDSKASFLFANATVDLTPPPAPLTSIDCCFGNITVRIPQGYSVRTVGRAAFGAVTAPQGSLSGFGDRVWIVGDGLQTQMEIRCLFGQVNILD